MTMIPREIILSLSEVMGQWSESLLEILLTECRILSGYIFIFLLAGHDVSPFISLLEVHIVIVLFFMGS